MKRRTLIALALAVGAAQAQTWPEAADGQQTRLSGAGERHRFTRSSGRSGSPMACGSVSPTYSILVTLTKPYGTGCSQEPHQPEEMLACAPANVKAASTAKAIATSEGVGTGVCHAADVAGGAARSSARRVSAVIGAMRAALEG
jgi:hypothetical protein